MNGARVLAVVEPVVFVMIGAALLLVFVRLARGPSLSDRVIALDLIAARLELEDQIGDRNLTPR